MLKKIYKYYIVKHLCKRFILPIIHISYNLKETSTFLIEPRLRKPVFAICEQQRRRSAWASANAQSDQRLCYLLPG